MYRIDLFEVSVMKIVVKQINCEGKNQFDIHYDDVLKYKARLPFVSINEPFDLEKLRKIKVYDLNDNEIYSTTYKYIENFKEEFILLKYLFTGSQKFNQVLFTSDNNVIKVYYESLGLMDNRYVIDINDKQYFCYSVEDGHIRHFPIYDNDIQIGEILKSNIVNDSLDEYYAYIKDEYSSISDGVMNLLLFLDRSEYSSSYLVNKSVSIESGYTFSKNNKNYDKNWVKDNFGDEFYKMVDEQVKFAKEKMKHPIKTSKEQWDSMSDKQKKIMKFVLIAPWVMIVVVAIFVGCIFLFT